MRQQEKKDDFSPLLPEPGLWGLHSRLMWLVTLNKIQIQERVCEWRARVYHSNVLLYSGSARRIKCSVQACRLHVNIFLCEKCHIKQIFKKRECFPTCYSYSTDAGCLTFEISEFVQVVCKSSRDEQTDQFITVFCCEITSWHSHRCYPDMWRAQIPPMTRGTLQPAALNAPAEVRQPNFTAPCDSRDRPRPSWPPLSWMVVVVNLQHLFVFHGS